MRRREAPYGTVRHRIQQRVPRRVECERNLTINLSTRLTCLSRGFTCNYCMQHTTIIAGIRTCWNACNYCSVLHVITAHETAALLHSTSQLPRRCTRMPGVTPSHAATPLFLNEFSKVAYIRRILRSNCTFFRPHRLHVVHRFGLMLPMLQVA